MAALFHGILSSNVASRKDNEALEKKNERESEREGGLGGLLLGVTQGVTIPASHICPQHSTHAPQDRLTINSVQSHAQTCAAAPACTCVCVFIPAHSEPPKLPRFDFLF